MEIIYYIWVQKTSSKPIEPVQNRVQKTSSIPIAPVQNWVQNQLSLFKIEFKKRVQNQLSLCKIKFKTNWAWSKSNSKNELKTNWACSKSSSKPIFFYSGVCRDQSFSNMADVGANFCLKRRASEPKTFELRSKKKRKNGRKNCDSRFAIISVQYFTWGPEIRKRIRNLAGT